MSALVRSRYTSIIRQLIATMRPEPSNISFYKPPIRISGRQSFFPRFYYTASSFVRNASFRLLLDGELDQSGGERKEPTIRRKQQA